MSESNHDEPKYINARQAYDKYGIPRSLLNELAANGKISSKRIKGTSMVLFLYSESDIRNVIYT